MFEGKNYSIVFGVLTVLFLLLSLGRVNAATPSCGVDKKCEPGYYCSGAVGESASGVCVANAANIAMCKAIDYLRNDVIKYFFLFGAAFAGLLMLMGKFAMTTLVQILLGIGIIYGAQNIMVHFAGSAKGLCGAEDALSCAEKTTGSKALSGSNIILNLSPVSIDRAYNPNNEKCEEPLQCFKATCDEYTKTETPIAGGGYKISYSKKGSTKTVEWVKGTGDTTLNFNGTNGGNSITVNCKPYYGTFLRDYFLCTNTCTNVTYGAEAQSNWKIESCADLAKKQIKL